MDVFCSGSEHCPRFVFLAGGCPTKTAFFIAARCVAKFTPKVACARAHAACVFIMAPVAWATLGVLYATMITNLIYVLAELVNVVNFVASYTLLANFVHVLGAVRGIRVRAVGRLALYATTFTRAFVSAKSTFAASCVVSVTMNS